jgi:hypothetical protein
MIMENPLAFPVEELQLDFLVEPVASVPYSQLRLVYLFVGLDGDLAHVLQETVPVEGSALSFGLLHACLRRACLSFPGTSYKLADTLVFELDVDHEDVSPLFNSIDLEQIIENHLRVLPFLNQIDLGTAPASLHDVNTVFFVLTEKETAGAKKPRLNLGSTFNEEKVDETDETPAVDAQDVVLNRTKRNYGSEPMSSAKPGWNKRVLRGTRKLR